MSSANPVRRPLPIRNQKSGVDATTTRGRANQALLAEQIRRGWKETLEGIVQTGRWLIAGKFRKADYQHYALPFSYSWGRKLCRIAESPRILNAVNRSILPDKADALHQIALLTERLFQLAVSERVIHSQCLVVDIKQFRLSFMEPAQSRRRRMTVVFECSPERARGALETLDAFVVAVQSLAQARFPAITVRGPRKMKELLLS